MVWHNLTAYGHPDFECIEKTATELNLHNGISHYWQAKPFTVFSHSHLNIVSMKKNLKPYYFIDTTHRYQNINFEFILLDAAVKPEAGPYLSVHDKDKIIQRFGQPTLTRQCGHTTMLVYQNGKLNHIF
jgi:hypothetical protein